MFEARVQRTSWFVNKTGKRKLYARGFCAAFLATATVPSWSQTALPKSMVALGDSMTAGALAGYRREDSGLPWKDVQVLLKILELGLTRKLSVVERRDYSWTTGRGARSGLVTHAARLQAMLNKENVKLKIANFSVSGAEASDVVHEQLDWMREWSLRHVQREAPDYVTVLIGANDVCSDNIDSMTATQDYFRHLQVILEEVVRDNPNTRVLVSELPNIEALRNVGVRAPSMLGTCQDVWNLTKMCPTLTTELDSAKRAVVAERVRDFNRVIEDVAERTNNAFGADRVRVANRVYDVPFFQNDLAVDCFHPNDKGQYRLSKSTWESSHWANRWNEMDEFKLRREMEKGRYNLPKKSASPNSY